jgi:AcrR family transcriptional regulator
VAVSPPRPRRRTGRPAGSPPNRAAILAAARHQFIAHGYDATVRDIAAGAGVDPALLYHYFGSKDRLLLAAIQEGAAGEVPIEGVIPQLLEGDPDRLGERLMRAVFAAYETSFYRAAWGSLVELFRLATAQPDAAGMLREGLTGGGLIRLVEALGVPHAQTRAALIGTELVGLALARFVLSIEPIASADLETLVAWYGPTLQRYLTEPLLRDAP